MVDVLVPDVRGSDATEVARLSAAAQKALLHELRGQGSGGVGTSVEVLRRPGGLVIELTAGPDMSRTQTQRLAAHVVHVVQAVRLHDRWAPKIDVVVHPDPLQAGRTID
jgi:hypothetical protein